MVLKWKKKQQTLVFNVFNGNCNELCKKDMFKDATWGQIDLKEEEEKIMLYTVQERMKLNYLFIYNTQRPYSAYIRRVNFLRCGSFIYFFFLNCLIESVYQCYIVKVMIIYGGSI